ncbi:protein SET DOMAIN GROUP 40-like [Euphorbia lathyris]|uniref:protein SET DOMAIN GROUP 40-like n=1 Tax=Euphorbia lathyris TaxID=212925 RepID=UPI003313EA1D
MENAEYEKLVGFFEWASKLGISDSPNNFHSLPPNSCLGNSLLLSYFPDAGGRGLGAARDLRKGELVLKVPKSTLITRDSLFRDEFLSSAVNNHNPLSPTQILAVCLLFEMGKGKSSFWYPYLIHLPRCYDILATFSEFEKQALQVDDAIWTAEKAISKAEAEWKEAFLLMQQLQFRPQFLTLRAWIWACATISSRTLHVPWDEAGCLCPVGDLFNYAVPEEEPSSYETAESWMNGSFLQDDGPLSSGISRSNVFVEGYDAHMQRLTDGGFDEDNAAYCFYARKNYKKGEQVLLSYGTYTNLELLEFYGFCLDENSNDKVFIPLEASMYICNSWAVDSLYIHEDGKPSFALLSALRLWATPPNQRRSIGHLAYSGSQLSVENEIMVLKWISKSCQSILKSLATTVEEDNLVLSSISKLQNLNKCREVKKMIQCECEFEGEVSAFLEANNVQKVENVCSKTKRSIERWKLAVEWRLRYKTILIDCISYCAQIIISLSTQNA